LIGAADLCNFILSSAEQIPGQMHIQLFKYLLLFAFILPTCDRQYEHLNNLRQDMIQRDVYNADMQGIKKSEKLIYVGLGLVIALQFILSIFIE